MSPPTTSTRALAIVPMIAPTTMWQATSIPGLTPDAVYRRSTPRSRRSASIAGSVISPIEASTTPT